MDSPRGASIALPPPTSESHWRRLSRSNSQTSSESGRNRTSMAIPGARMNDIPPALPPPRYIDDLDDGVDIAWHHQNEGRGHRRLAPIKAGSSLFGRAQLRRDHDEDIDIDMDMDMDTDHTAQSPLPLQIATGTSIPSLVRRPPSSSGTNQRYDTSSRPCYLHVNLSFFIVSYPKMLIPIIGRLQGENPLVQQNHNQSTHAYDKHLLLKIGKSNSPSLSKAKSGDHPSKLSIQTKGPSLLARPAREASSWDKYMTSPTSAVSPASRVGWRECSMDPRSPASESTSYSTELEPFPRHVSARPRVEPMYSPEDTRTRSERGSYDSAYSAGDEHSFIEECPRLATHHGTKRRALSPPREAGHEQRQEPLKRLQSRSDLQIAVANQPYKTGSLSSTASSNPYYSYASSNILSSASSMTSISSMDTSLSREPSRQLFASPTSANSTSGVAILPLRKAPEPLNKTAAQPDLGARPSRIGNHWICSCCPKKPRKFETEEQLR